MTRPRVISWFAGVGGFDAAILAAGHEVVGACEVDAACRKVYAARFGEPRWFARDIAEVHADEIPEADLWCGGPPCQSFSVAGKRGGIGDARGNLFLRFLALAAIRKPPVLLIENVPGLLSSDDGRDFGAILAALVAQGRRVAWATLDARYFGVAQRRRRIFLLASLAGDPRAVLFDAGTEPPSRGAPDALVRGDTWYAPQEFLFSREGAAPFDGAAWPGSGYAAGGRCWVRDVPEWREPVGRASLAATLEAGPILARFFLSPRACAGILRRAERRGRALPTALDAALRATADPNYQPTTDNDAQAGRLVCGTLAASGAGSARPAGQKNELDMLILTADTAPTVRAADGHHGRSSPRGDGCDALVIAGQCHGSNVGPVGELRRGNGGVTGGVPFVALAVEALGRKMSGGAKVGDGVRADEAFALDADPRVQGVLAFESRVARNGRGAQGEVVPPLKAQSGADGRGDGAPLLAFTVHAETSRGMLRGAHPTDETTCLSGARGGFESAQGGTVAVAPQIGRIRRLTTTETERLQSFADGHTCLCGVECRKPGDRRAPPWWPATIRAGGCGHAACGCECSDGPRYRMLGNAVAVPVVAWIARRLAGTIADRAGPTACEPAGAGVSPASAGVGRSGEDGS